MRASAKRPPSPSRGGAGSEVRKNHFPNFKPRRHDPVQLAQSEHNKPFILKAVAKLTERTAECSSTEVAAAMMEKFTDHEVHSIGRTLAVYKDEGLVTNRKLYRLSLWKLTEAGKKYVKGIV